MGSCSAKKNGGYRKAVFDIQIKKICAGFRLKKIISGGFIHNNTHLKSVIQIYKASNIQARVS